VLECSLEEVPLDQQPDYEALSYAWGKQDTTGGTYILCCGKRITITPNCAAALIHLRHEAEPRVLWIDAICINQANVREKNHQVSLMGDIYRNAKCTLMWLGEITPDARQNLLMKLVLKARDDMDTSDGEADPELREIVQTVQSIDGNKSPSITTISTNRSCRC
jgi:hypothetical protein